MEINKLTGEVIGAAIEVHKALGPGLLESAYEECLCRELDLRKIAYERQKELPVEYKGVRLDCGYRLDVVVGDKLIVELKAVESLLPIHKAQLLTYLKLTGIKTGLIINFNVSALKDGVQRISN
jgi:GxxExxY protein